MSEREKLEAERAKLDARSAKRQAEAERDHVLREKLNAAIHRLDLAELVGVPGAVVLRVRGSDPRIPDDARGTITKVNRTRASVDFGEHGHDWSIPLQSLLPAGKMQGWTIHIGGAP